MFTTKQSSLLSKPSSVSIKTDSKNTTKIGGSIFVTSALKKGAETLSGNGAKKYTTTGNPFVDQFGKLGSYKVPRSFEDISKDCDTLWAQDKELAVKFFFYLRTINRQVQLMDGSKTSVPQKGGELKHESIMRLIWLHLKSPETFWNNISLFISVGSWKDIFQMLSYDLQFNGWNNRKLNWTKFGELVLSGLENPNTLDLVKKYLPQIKATSACKTLESQADTLIAKWICSLLFGAKDESSNNGSTYKKYRKLKTSGLAHEWQKLISTKQFERIDFSKIHGRALSLLVRSNFLKNQDLTSKYETWITAPETVDVKYTGFVHELFQPCQKYRSLVSMPVTEQATINKQFQTLVDKAGDSEATPLIVVRDTSSSMGDQATGTPMSCYNVAKALALYFSEFLTGKFQDAWIEFNSSAKMHTWNGNTPLEKWYNDNSKFIGDTDFQSVIQLFVSLKKQGIPESEFPKGILCISDNEFNPSSLNSTNVEDAKSTLLYGGFTQEYVDNFIIVLWNLQNSYYGSGSGSKFETYGDVKNVFYFSGYSAATVSFLTSKIETAYELFQNAMNQEILNMVIVS